MKGKRILTLLLAASLTATSLNAMSQTASVGTRTFEVSASIKPATPKTGENILDVSFMEGTKPVKGLKLTASVGMTNMDMGTAHPPVREASPGHYALKPTFLMEGPWRVTLASKEPKFTVSFDITTGGNKPWPAVKKTITVVSPKAVDPQNPRQEAAKTDSSKTEPAKQEPAKQEPAKKDQAYGHDMAAMGHVASSLPQLKEKAAYAWTGSEDWDTRTGFGKLEPMVRMMTLMMVTGSGMEGMKMAPMAMVFNDSNFMEGGDQAMKDMPTKDMNPGALKVEAKLDKAAVGDNNITITLATPDGKPVEKAKITAAVAMTSMDMGTTHPAVKELGKGKYSLSAKFSMMGPWRLTLNVAAPDMKPADYKFAFEAK